MNAPRMLNDFRPEITSLLNRMTAAGFTLTHGDNGEEQFRFDGDVPKFVAKLEACDEAWLYATQRDGKRVCVFLVLGNEPGVIAADHTDTTELGAVTSAHYDEWESKEQPKISEADKYPEVWAARKERNA